MSNGIREIAERCINENGDALVGSWDRDTFLRIVEERDALARYALDREAGWQPIATAPKDYTSVLLHEPGRYTGQGHYASHLRCWHYDSPFLGGNPTHWMPLPAPPRGAEREGR